MTTLLRVPYTRVALPFPTLRPILAVTLSNPPATLTADALVDSGSDTNVLPWDLGAQLGCDWSRAFPLPPISGALASTPTRAVILSVKVGTFPLVSLAFGWVQSNAVPLILGQTNFFLEFDVCFYASRGEFTIAPRTP
jgi:hypothetical protein